MALQVFKGTLTAPSTTGNQAYTGVGFQPKALIFFGTRQTATGYAVGMGAMLGYAVSSSGQVVVATCANDNVSPTQPARGINNGACIQSMTPATAAVDIQGLLVTMDADGFTINWTSASAGTTFIVHYVALGGSDITGAAVGTGTANTSTGTKAYTGTGFQPDFVMTGHMSTSSAPPVTLTGGRLGIGAAATGGSGAAYIGEVDGVASSDVVCYANSGVVFAQGNPSAAVAIVASLSSFDADGFTFNFTTVSGSAIQFIWLALKGGRYNVLSDTQKTSTGTQAKTGFGFQPTGLLFFGNNKALSASADSTLQKLSMGATDGTNQGATWEQGTDAVNPTDENSATVTSAVLRHATNPSTTDAEAVISSLDADGYTLNWTTADATTRDFIAVAFGSAGAPVFVDTTTRRYQIRRSRMTSW